MPCPWRHCVESLELPDFWRCADADENILLRDQLQQLCSTLAQGQPRVRDAIFENTDLRRRIAAVRHLVAQLDSSPVGPKSILKLKGFNSPLGARNHKHITFNPGLEIGPTSAADPRQLLRMRSAWKV